MKNSIVTGGAGFIVSNFIHWVLANKPDVQITALDALTYAGNRTNLADHNQTKLIFTKSSNCDAKLVNQLSAKADAHIHFATENHNDDSITNPSPFLRANIQRSYTLLEAARKHSVRFRHISTDEAYGDLALDKPQQFTEESPYRPSSSYSPTKAASNHLIRTRYRAYSAPATISNCSNNYIPRQHIEKFIPRQITDILCGLCPKPYDNGQNVRDWIHINDHSSVVWTILERDKSEETYLTGVDEEHNNIDILQAILSIMRRGTNDFNGARDRSRYDRRHAIDLSKLRCKLSWIPQYSNSMKGIFKQYVGIRRMRLGGATRRSSLNKRMKILIITVCEVRN